MHQQNIADVAMPHTELQRDHGIVSIVYVDNDLIPSPALCPGLFPYPYVSPSACPVSASFPFLAFPHLCLSPLLPSPCWHSLRYPFTSSMTLLTSVTTCGMACVVFLFSLGLQFQYSFSVVYLPNYESFISCQT